MYCNIRWNKTNVCFYIYYYCCSFNTLHQYKYKIPAKAIEKKKEVKLSQLYFHKYSYTVHMKKRIDTTDLFPHLTLVFAFQMFVHSTIIFLSTFFPRISLLNSQFHTWPFQLQMPPRWFLENKFRFRKCFRKSGCASVQGSWRRKILFCPCKFFIEKL